MTQEIIYKDFFIRPITEQQAQHADYYFKYYIIDNVVKRIDFFDQEGLSNIKYYLHFSEDKEEIILELGKSNPNSEQIIIVDRQIHGTHTAEYCEVYRPSGELFIETKELYDDKERCLCSIHVSNQTLFPNESHVRKYYYDEELYPGWLFDEDPTYLVFEGHYNVDGSLDSIHFNPKSDQDDQIFRSDNYNELVSICGLSPELADFYYTDKFLPDLPY
jgi:hypothetical protein